MARGDKKPEGNELEQFPSGFLSPHAVRVGPFDDSSTRREGADLKKWTRTYDSGSATSRKSVACAITIGTRRSHKMSYPGCYNNQSLVGGWRTEISEY
jgi:hypothetical protein